MKNDQPVEKNGMNHSPLGGGKGKRDSSLAPMGSGEWPI